jgi:hypothetical protein
MILGCLFFIKNYQSLCSWVKNNLRSSQLSMGNFFYHPLAVNRAELMLRVEEAFNQK